MRPGAPGGGDLPPQHRADLPVPSAWRPFSREVRFGSLSEAEGFSDGGQTRKEVKEETGWRFGL